MKLIQLNIWGGKLQYQIPNFINAEQPDIVCMQEVHDLPGPSGAVFITLDELQEKCGFEYKFMSPTYTSSYQRRRNRFGNAILSKYPIISTDTVFTYGAYNDDFDLTQDDFNARNLQHAIIDYNGATLNVFNHHGFLVIGSKAGNDETYRQMQLISKQVSEATGPTILTGDFNLAPTSQSIQLLNAQLRNLSVEHGLTSTYAPEFNINNEVCDYIFVNDQVKVNDFVLSNALVSDHKALLLEFSI